MIKGWITWLGVGLAGVCVAGLGTLAVVNHKAIFDTIGRAFNTGIKNKKDETVVSAGQQPPQDGGNA